MDDDDARQPLIARGLELREHPPEHIGCSIGWLRKHLASLRRPVAEGSPLDRALNRCAELKRCFEEHRAPRFTTPREELEWFGDAFGADYMTRALHHAVHNGLEVPGKLWRALADPRADVMITRRGQESESRNLVWELLLGALCHRVAEGVRFAEPDVTCSFQGERMAIAAKVSYKRGNIWSNAVDVGFRQADGHGTVRLVAIATADILPLRNWFRISRRLSFPKGIRSGVWISRKAGLWCDDTLNVDRAVPDIARRVNGPSGVVFFMPIVVAVEGTPVSFFYLHMPITWRSDEGPDFAFVSALCQTSKSVLDWVAA